MSSSTSSLLLSSDKELRTQVVLRKRELIVERRNNNILFIQINRPEFRNALNRNAVYELIAAFAEATHNDDIEMVVLTGSGNVFCAGNDLKQITTEYANPEDYFRGANYTLRSLVKSIMVCPKLCVCLVNGPCIGIGFTLAALFDLVYCTRSAYFQAPFTKLGICPEACSSFTFSQQFGQSWANKLLILGEKLTAEKAEQFGFVCEIFEDPNEVEQKFWLKMLEYTKLPRDAVHTTKRLMLLQREPQLLTALEAELKEISKLRKGPVYRNALKEFVQKSSSFNKSKL